MTTGQAAPRLPALALLDSGLASWVVGHLFVHFTPEHWTPEHSVGSVGMELVRGHNTLVNLSTSTGRCVPTQHVASSSIAHDTINTRTRSE